MRSALLLSIVLLSACSSIASRQIGNQANASGKGNGAAPLDLSRYRTPRALDQYVERLTAEGRDWQQHGIYIESLDQAEPIALLNEANEFNPASVMKLATSLAALHRLGSEHRFRTAFRADGELRAGILEGDLILLSGGDPAFSINDARRAGAALRQAGIRRVNGRLVVVGEFTCNENSSTAVSARVFARNAGLVFKNPPQLLSASGYKTRGNEVLAIESDTLLRIVQYLNAFSVNSMAEMLAQHVGGPRGIEKFLIDEIGMPRQSVFISHASGLEINRLTPRDTVRMLRAMIAWLDRHQLSPSSVMPVAGRDEGTLRRRFTESDFAGSVIAKTGTLYSTDSGVAALAGIMYTRDQGPLLFAVYDMAEGRQVHHLRQIQDQFIKDLIRECGGPAPVPANGQKSPTAPTESRVKLANGQPLERT